MNIIEDYGEYRLTARWDPDSVILRGIISGDPDTPIPHDVLARLHGGSRDIWEFARLMSSAEIPDIDWAFQFLCNHPGDVVIVNGEVVADQNHSGDLGIRREWTMDAVLQHMKDCIDA